MHHGFADSPGTIGAADPCIAVIGAAFRSHAHVVTAA